MVGQIFLRVSADVAKEQLAKRVSVQISGVNDDPQAEAQRREWNLANIRVLEAMFSSEQVANDYKACGNRHLMNGKFGYDSLKKAQDFLKALAETLPLYPEEPPKPTVVTTAPEPAGLSVGTPHRSLSRELLRELRA
jgi:hypothetical protein